MTAVPFTPEQERKLAEFDAAPQLAESSPIVRAVLALHQRAHPDGPTSCVECNKGRKFVPYPCPTVRTVAAVLAADPDPRDAVIERMARAMWEDERGSLALDWAEIVESARVEYRRRSAVALDASRGGTQ